MLAKYGAIYLVAKFFPAPIALGILAILTRNISPQEYGFYSLTILTAGFINSVFLQWIILGVGRYLPDCKNVIIIAVMKFLMSFGSYSEKRK